MDANGALLITSLVSLGLTRLYCLWRWDEFDLADLYVLVIAVYFGLYTLLSALFQDLAGYDAISAVIVHILVAINICVTRLLVFTLPPRVRDTLTLRHIVAVTQGTPLSALVCLAAVSSLLSLHGFYRYGVLASASSEQILGGAPYWFTSAKQIEYAGVVPGLFLGLLLYLLGSRTIRRVVALIALLDVIALQVVWGRRAVFELLLLAVLMLSIVHGRNPFKLKQMVAWTLGGAIALGVLSNVYQAYRIVIGSPTAIQLGELPESGKPFWEAAGDWDATLSDLKERAPDWKYDYLVLEIVEQQGSLDGRLMMQAFANLVPGAIWRDKRYINADAELAALYGLEPTDYTTNLFGITLADFGYVGLLAPALIMWAMIAVAGEMLVFAQRSPTLFLITVGLVFDSLLAIEGTYESLFALGRSFGLVFAVFVVIRVLATLLGAKSAFSEA